MALISELRICFYSAWTRLSIDYQKLKLSYLWESVSLLFVVTFLSLVWGRVLESGSKSDYFFYVLTGFCIWGLMSRSIDQSLSFGNRMQASMRRGATSVNREVTIEVFICFFQFLLTFPFVLAACWWFYGVSIIGSVWLCTSLICILLTAIALFKTLAFLAYFFEDISRFVKMVMRVAFLVTPILWHPKMIGETGEHLVYLNPFFTYLDVFRSAITGQPVSPTSLLIMFSLTLVLVLIALKLSDDWERKILKDIFLDRNA